MPLTNTKYNDICTDNDRTHGRWEELANTTQNHNYTHGDVNDPAGDRQPLFSNSSQAALQAAEAAVVRDDIQNV